MAAKAARPAAAIELPTVLAAPVKVAMWEPVADGGMTLGGFLLEKWRFFTKQG